MHKEQIDTRTGCLECDLPAYERLNYFTGQFLAERDFRDEQSYHLGKRRHHNRDFHGWGTVCGLRVVQHPDPACRHRFVIIEPGVAVDCCGREIVVREKVYVDLLDHLPDCRIDPADPRKHVLLSLCYTECKTEYVPALYTECGCDDSSCEASRVYESFKVKAERVEKLEEPPRLEPISVHMKWITTLNLDKAYRLALDQRRQRLYVLTSSNVGDIMVYDTDNHCLLCSIRVLDPAVDIAVSPSGDWLYVIRRVSRCDYSLRIFDVGDCENVQPICEDIELSSNESPEKAPQLVVAPSDGRIFVLDPAQKKVLLYDSPRPGGQIQKFGEIDTGDDPAAIAVSPNGVWLFIAEAAVADNHVKAVKVETLISDERVIQFIPISDPPPQLVAVSGNNRKLYVATAGKNLFAFHIEESPDPFPAIGTGVSIGPERPVALAASPGGKWAYVLVEDNKEEKGGWIRIINGAKMESDPDHAVSDPIAVLPRAQDLLLAPNGQPLYAAGDDIRHSQCGGVSVLEVKEEPCSAILWYALEGCSLCDCHESPDDCCVPLAGIRDYVECQMITDRHIDNRIRPLVPSTNRLQEALLCAIEARVGQQGPEGPQGLPGGDGLGLDLELPKILDIGWMHGSKIAWEDLRERHHYQHEIMDCFKRNPLLTLYFNKPVMKGIDRQTFQVSIVYPQAQGTSKFTGLYNRANLQIYGHIVELPGPPPTPHTRESALLALAFIPDKAFFSDFTWWKFLKDIWLGYKSFELELPYVHILLKGDFVWALPDKGDEFDERRMLDANNIGGRLGTNRKRGGAIRGGKNPSGNLVQGGDFESWFFLEPPVKPYQQSQSI
ncbi:MAG: YncE family protein [bacterium]